MVIYIFIRLSGRRHTNIQHTTIHRW